MTGFDLTGRHALVTGASSGLGAHFAQVLSKAGAELGLAGRRQGRLADLSKTLSNPSHVITMDVTDSESITAGLNQYQDSAGCLPDVLVNNAGIADGSGFLDAERSKTQEVFATNQMAAFDMAQAISRRWIKAKRGGVIINITSIAGTRVLGGAAAYAASKAALTHLTRLQAFELARHDIRVNAIAPGYFKTEMNEGFLDSDAGKALINRVPMRRSGELCDLDGVLLLLASDMSAYMTGAVIAVDGGHLCSSL